MQSGQNGRVYHTGCSVTGIGQHPTFKPDPDHNPNPNLDPSVSSHMFNFITSSSMSWLLQTPEITPRHSSLTTRWTIIGVVWGIFGGRVYLYYEERLADRGPSSLSFHVPGIVVDHGVEVLPQRRFRVAEGRVRRQPAQIIVDAGEVERLEVRRRAAGPEP